MAKSSSTDRGRQQRLANLRHDLATFRRVHGSDQSVRGYSLATFGADGLDAAPRHVTVLLRLPKSTHGGAS